MPDILPDCRAARPTGGKFRLGLWWVPIYCANCHSQGGYIPDGPQHFAFWLCDACYETHGPVAGTMVLPDEAESLRRL